VQLLWLLVQLRHWCRGKQFTKLKFVELKRFFPFWTGIVISIGWPQYPSRWWNQQKSNMYICPVVLVLCAKQNKRQKKYQETQNLKTSWKSTARQ
jgi:hypothetical protein